MAEHVVRAGHDAAERVVAHAVEAHVLDDVAAAAHRNPLEEAAHGKIAHDVVVATQLQEFLARIDVRAPARSVFGKAVRALLG